MFIYKVYIFINMKKTGKSKFLIFDFDGTIANTKALYYSAIYNEVKIFGYSYKQVDKVIDLGLSLKNVLRKLGFSFFVAWFLHRKIMKNVTKHVNRVKKCKDVDCIREIKTNKILLSNSLKEFVMPIIKHFKLKSCFKKIYGAEDFSNKVDFIKSYLRKNKIKRKNCYYVGDRVADVKIAKEVKCKSIIIAGKCAWDSRAEILREQPDFIISDIKEIKKIVK